MTVDNPSQNVLVTAIPRGYVSGGPFDGHLRVGVRLTIRLSYTGGPATLADFPAFHAWPMGGLSWRASFDNGATWQPAAEEIWRSDQGFWAATFPQSLRVDSKPVAPPAVTRTVSGYSYKELASRMQDFHLADAFEASPLGAALVPHVFGQRAAARSSIVVPPELATAVDSFLAFYRRPRRTTDPIPPSSLDPDFHQRIALLSDHGPLLERLGLVLELLFPPRAQTISRLIVEAVQESPPDNPPIQFAPAYTAVRHVPGSLFAASTTAPGLDERLRLRLNDSSRFGVHAIDVDASLINAFGVADRTAALPPPPQTTGFTITQDKTPEILTGRLAAGKTARAKLAVGDRPTLGADTMIQGYLVEVLREAVPSPTWRSLCHRSVTYTAYGDGTGDERSFTADSEAPVIAGIRVKDNPNNATDTSKLETSDVLFRWDGWSLAFERPGRYQLQEDASTGDVVDTPGSFPGGTIDIAASAPSDPAHRLPVLRFGNRYRFRARAVDVTGFAHPWDGADADLVMSPSTPYYRFDPVATPLVLNGPVPTRTETSLRLVVRSDPRSNQPATVTSRRTIVPARASVEMAMTHGLFDEPGFAAPDPAKWSLIADLDDKVPPPVWPPEDGPDPGPPVVDWLPDPMTVQIGAFLTSPVVPAPLRKVSFLPAGSDAEGRSTLGGWQSVAIELQGGTKTGSPKLLPTVEGARQRTLPVQLPAGWQQTIVIRGLPPASRLGQHGLAQWLPAATRSDRIFNLGFDQMCPPVRLTLVHAVRQPLTNPSTPGGVVADRETGQKDPAIHCDVTHDGLSTGRLTIVGSWSYWKDEGGFIRTSKRFAPPKRINVKYNAVAEAEASAPTSGQPTKLVAGNLVAPDLRRIDVSFRLVATSRYVEEFRDELAVTWSTVAGVDGLVLDLPTDVDVESVRLLRGSRDLVRATECRFVEDPRTQRRTLALAPGDSADDVTVLGVRGTVLASGSGGGTVIIPAAMRPLPPDVAYVLPTFTGASGGINPVTGHAEAFRGNPRVRIWLERPWWSSGDQEKLAVLWSLDPAPADIDDDKTNGFVTLFGQDPLYDQVKDIDRMVEPTSGEPLPPALGSHIVLDEDIATAPPTAKVRLHDVQYDAGRDLYYTEVEWPEHRGNKFVRMAVARFQQHVTPGLSQLSRIRSIDPVRLLPARKVDAWNVSTRSFTVKVAGLVDPPATAAQSPRLRVSLQQQTVSGDPDLGWDTVDSKEVVLSGRVYPNVTLLKPTTVGVFRVLVEESEPMLSRAAGGLPADNTYVQQPQSVAAAVGDLTARRPVWVTTLPLPTNTP